jgi:ketosteroid isomerase-like protein
MSEENVELVRKSIEAWNQRDLETLMSYTTSDVEWEAGGPAAVEQPLYAGRDELTRGTEALWETWEEFRLQETEVRDLGDSVLWMGRMQLRGGASHVELDQEFAIRYWVRDGEIARGKAFLSWQEALEDDGLQEIARGKAFLSWQEAPEDDGLQE